MTVTIDLRYEDYIVTYECSGLDEFLDFGRVRIQLDRKQMKQLEEALPRVQEIKRSDE